MSSTSLENIISNAESAGARVGVCAVLPDGSRFTHRENEIFKSASCIKIAIMVELFRRIDVSELTLHQKYVLTDEDKAITGGILQELHTGIELTLRDVCYLMMSISDNASTNILIDLLGMDAINATMKSLGMEKSHLGRPMRGRPANANEQENLAKPTEFVALVNTILDGTAASAESCMAMMAIMELQANSRRIGRFVLDGTVWGSKTGSYDTVVNDCGYIQTADGPLVVAMFSENVADVTTGEIVLSEIVRELLASAN